MKMVFWKADPDPAHLDADPDPDFLFDADPAF
jgi:hypothetical protein